MGQLDQNDANIWDDLLTSLQRFCGIYWGPTEDACRQLIDPNFWQPIRNGSSLDETSLNSSFILLSGIISGFSEPEALYEYLEEGYVRLFINNRGGIVAPLYASCYENEADPQLMGDAAVQMQKLLSELEIYISEDVSHPPDHIAIQLEVLYFILARDPVSFRRQNIMAASIFAAESILPWVSRLNDRLAGETRCRFYPLVTELLLSVLETIVALPESD